jgi:putative ABC transport system permease protein
LGLRLLAGRDLSDTDFGRQVALVNRSFAQHFVQSRSAVGQELRLLDGNKRFEIVGVVNDARDRGLKRPTEPVIYTWWEHDLVGWMTFSVRGQIDGNQLRAVLRSVDPAVPVNQVETADERLNRDLARERMMATLGSAFGLAAAFIAGVGLYAALAFSISRRTREFGIRRALGAPARNVAAVATRHAATALAGGLLAGLPAAVVAGRTLESQLFGVHPADPWLLLAVTIFMLGAGALALAAPARRALRIDPAQALRHDE